MSLSVGYIILLYLALHLLSPALLYLLFNMTYTSMGGWSTQFMPIPHSNLKIGIGINWVKLAPTGFFFD